MAEASIMSIDSETLRNKITCSICSKNYSNPKTLPCLHSFCLACLAAINKDESSGMLRLVCPECGKDFSHSDKALVNLPDAFQINRHLEYHKFKQRVLGKVSAQCEKCSPSNKVSAVAFCTDCTKFICDLCLKIHNSWSELQSHKTLKIYELRNNYQKYVPTIFTKLDCSIHGTSCTAFCETCDELICHECILKTHRDHQCYHSDESAKSHKKELIEELDTINYLPTQLHTAITVIDKIMENYSSQGRDVEGQLLAVLDKLEKLLAQQREWMNAKLSDCLSDKIHLLSHQKQTLERMMMKINSCISFVSETTESNQITEFFILEKLMKKRITELQKEFSMLELQPIEEPEVHFSFNNEALDVIENSIQISDGSILHGTATSFTVGEVICFYVSLSSAFYKTKDNPMDELVAEIESLRDGSVCPATIAVSSNGFAKLQCSFSERGRYSVKVQISGKHITGSPYQFYVKPNGTHLQQPIKSITKLQGPKAIALTPTHQLAICEENRHSVSIYSLKNKKAKATIGQYGREKGYFSHPTGVALDEDGNIYVADSKNDRVQKFDCEGTFLCEFKEISSNSLAMTNSTDKESSTTITSTNSTSCSSSSGSNGKANKLHLPSNIKLGPDGFVYVVDRGNNRIVILTKELQYVSTFGSAGYGLGSLHDPWDLAFDRNGFIYITDRRQHCIQIFTRNGAFRGKIGSQGQQKGKLNHPTGIAIDRFGKIYVCESGNHRISIFRVSSEFVECFSIGLSMVNPCGVTVDKDGFLYVACDETVHVF